MKFRKRIGGVGVQLADLSADLLTYKLNRADAFSVVAVACIVAFQGFYAGASWLAMSLAATFCSLLFLVLKLSLPLALYARVGDMIRFRYPFYTICAVGAVVVQAWDGFWPMFSSVSVQSACALLGVAVVLANMVFMRYGGRLMLALSYLVSGGLCVCGFFGVVVMVLAWIARYSLSSRVYSEVASLEISGEISSEYLVEFEVLRRNSQVLRRSRILCALMFLGGIGLTMIVMMGELMPAMSRSEAVRAILVDWAGGFRSFLTVGSVAPLVMHASLLFIALYFVYEATDVLERLRGSLMLLFAVIMAVSLCWSVGLLGRLPPFVSLGCGGLLPAVLSSFSLVLSASVFVVELGCRDLSAIGYDDDEMEMVSRGTRMFRVVAFVLSMLAIVTVVPVLI